MLAAAVNPEVTQPSLLSRVRDPADQQAWGAFESKYRDLILRYCRRRGLQQADAEDVRQLTMMKLVRSLPRFVYDPERGRFRDYLYRVLKNALNDATARPSVTARAVVFVEDVPDAASPAGDDVWEQEWVDHHYRLAMTTIRATFDPRSVQAFERLLAGDPIEMVARQFDMTPAGLHKVKQRVRDRLKELIEAQLREENDVGA